MTARVWAAVVLGGLVIAVLVVAAVLVPWHRPPAPRADQLAALRDLPDEQVARGGRSTPHCARDLTARSRWAWSPRSRWA